MLAIIYLAAATYFGDCICRRFFRFISLQHRLATSFLVGLLFTTWLPLLAAVVFHSAGQPLVLANLAFLVTFAATAFLTWRYASRNEDVLRTRPATANKWNLVWLAGFLLFATWLMFATLDFKGGQFQIAFKAWTDFGANVSLTQSFALGHNFPPQHPFFPGEFIRYHFLFWFQAGNLEFLGLNPVWSINILSILSLLALLILIITFGEVLFNSRVVGRIGALLFFFSSSLSYLPFLKSQGGIRAALNSIVHASEFLASGYPFRGEAWGVLSANVFAYQRHLISGIGLLFVVMIFAIEKYRAAIALMKKEKLPVSIVPPADDGAIAPTPVDTGEAEPLCDGGEMYHRKNLSRTELLTWIFCGVIIGLLPYWNSPTYIAALVLFGCLLVLAPVRIGTVCLIAAAIVVGLPQVLLLRSGNVLTYSLFNPGYTIENPTLWLILKYLAWTFGVKWILLGVALVFTNGLQRRLLLALSSLVAIVFLFQLSVDIFNNHKLLNIWATCVNVYAAYALWRIAKQRIVGPVLANVLALATVFSGVIDLFPLHND